MQKLIKDNERMLLQAEEIAVSLQNKLPSLEQEQGTQEETDQRKVLRKEKALAAKQTRVRKLKARVRKMNNVLSSSVHYPNMVETQNQIKREELVLQR